MNVQEVIEKALAGNEGIPVNPVEHSACEDEQIEKLAAALNFIGTNLESSLDEIEQEKSAVLDLIGGGVAGGMGASSSRRKMRQAGMSEDEIDDVQTTAGGAARGAGKAVLGGLGGYLLGGGKALPSLAGGALGAYAGYAGEKARGRRALKRREAAQDQRELQMLRQNEKSASVDDSLYYAAQVGKQALLEKVGGRKLNISEAKRRAMIQAGPPASFETHADNPIYKLSDEGRKKTAAFQKVAEDRINPAKISAGPAAPYSGEIMPNPGKVSNEFVGNTRDHHALIALKAQKVRDRINKDMKQYVNNVGDGYNLQGHLNKMNK